MDRIRRFQRSGSRNGARRPAPRDSQSHQRPLARLPAAPKGRGLDEQDASRQGPSRQLAYDQEEDHLGAHGAAGRRAHLWGHDSVEPQRCHRSWAPSLGTYASAVDSEGQQTLQEQSQGAHCSRHAQDAVLPSLGGIRCRSYPGGSRSEPLAVPGEHPVVTAGPCSVVACVRPCQVAVTRGLHRPP